MAARPAAIEYELPAPPLQQRRVSRRVSPRAIASPKPQVRPLRQREPLPFWLRQLMIVQRGSALALLMMGGLTLLAYSWTVHSQRSWSRAYSQLSLLRRDEPQLTRANEVLKENLAQQAESENSGLIEPTPAHMFYLEPAQPRPAQVVPDPPAPPPSGSELPLSY